MRRGWSAEKPFYLEDEETKAFMGFNLGSDFCSEHEWGLTELRLMFGVPDEAMGIEKRTITKVPRDLKYRLGKKGKPNILAIVSQHNWEGFEENPEKKWGYWGELQEYTWKGKTDPPVEFHGAWSGRDFGIAAYSDKAKERLELLVTAFDKKDVSMWIGGTGGNPFARGGLVLAITSLVPEKYRQLMLEADVDRHKLEQADEKTGIKALLKKAGKTFYALSPRWSDQLKSTKDGEVKTSHPVMYWLNPHEQGAYNSGWYTVEQLELWAKNEGPVIKTKEERKRA